MGENKPLYLLLVSLLLTSLCTLFLVAYVTSLQGEENLTEFDTTTEPLSIEDFRRYAEATLPPTVWTVVRDGALYQTTIRENPAAFSKYKIYPHALVDVSAFSSQITVFNQILSTPIALAPASFQKLVHPDGEVASAGAARDQGTVFSLSYSSSTSMEELQMAIPDAIKWQQIYILNNFNISLDLVRRAERAGFKAIIVTIDKPVRTIRYTFTKEILKVLGSIPMKNFEVYGDRAAYRANFVLTKQTWQKLALLCAATDLPVVVKGILRWEDVARVAESGARGIIVSNHGGRSIDEVVPAIDALERVAEEARRFPGLEVFMDSGVRSGLDVFKALALGARMVFVGRPMFWGLAHSGQDGVNKVLTVLNKELQYAAQMAGVNNVTDIDRTYLVKT